jgi:uncharacterized protein (DUF1778 family)
MLAKSKEKKKNHVYAWQTQFRFASEEHRDLVRRAAEDAGLSVNAWMVSATLQAARKQLAK